MENNVFKVVLLQALPASGKSEVRNFMANIEPERLKKEFHIGENLQLDDFPYVHMMRRIDNELEAMGQARLFYPGEEPFIDGRDWGTLCCLLNEDYHDLLNRNVQKPDSCAQLLFDRYDRAGQIVGIAAVTEDAATARGGQGVTQTAHEGPLAGIAALPAVHRHFGQGKGIVPHFQQGQPLRPGPAPRRLALGLRHMRPRGVQGQHVAARTPQGETEETAVQPAGKGHGQRPVPQHGQQGLPAGFGSYHVRRTLAPFSAMTSLHWRMVYCP